MTNLKDLHMSVSDDMFWSLILESLPVIVLPQLNDLTSQSLIPSSSKWELIGIVSQDNVHENI